MNNTRDIRRRIKSVKNIAQITKAMELVAAAKMRKAQSAALASRPYSHLSGEIMNGLLSKVGEVVHPLVSQSRHNDLSLRKRLIILISSDRGLAGALNTNVVNAALKLATAEGEPEADFITVGKKSADMVRRLNLNIVAAFPGKDKDINIFDAKAIAEVAVADFLDGRYGRVFVVYTDFISTLKQEPKVLQLLPLEISAHNNGEEYIFEPNVDSILDNLLRRSIEFVIFQTLVESVASEHSARMVAMRNANQAASDVLGDLQLSYNQARQAAITSELAEISAAKLAMEG